MGHMIIKPEIVVNDRMIDMIEFEEVPQRPCPLVWRTLHAVDFDRFDVYDFVQVCF